MWNFSWYTSEERAFSFSQETSETTGAGAGAAAVARAGAWAFKTALKIRCKSSLEYLGTLVVAAGDFGLRGPLDCSEDFELGGREKPGGTTEGVIERRSRQG